MAKNSKNNAKATEEKAVVTEVKDSNIVDSVEALEAKLAQVREAQKKFSTYTQEQVDKIFKAAAIAANQARIPLAKQAVEETGMGVVEDKVTTQQNIFTTHTRTQRLVTLSKETKVSVQSRLQNQSVL